MIALEDWMLIRQRVAAGVSQRQVARDLGVARATVARAVAKDTGPTYPARPRRPSVFDAYEAQVRALLCDHPTMPATVLAERVDWGGSASLFRLRVSEIRGGYIPADPVDRLRFHPGEVAQCDLWFPPVKNSALSGFPVLVVVSAHSRYITAVMLPSKQTPDLVLGLWHVLETQLGGVPRRLWWDNEAGIGRGGRLTPAVVSLCGMLATKIVQLPPFDPESKGIVERANRYLASSFLPGRQFTSPHDFNTQLREWLPRTHHRLVRAINAKPIDVITEDRAHMLPLPPIRPQIGWWIDTRLGRDYHVRVDRSDYSVDPRMIGKMVHVHAGLNRVTITADTRVVGDHARSWHRSMVVTDPGHVHVAAQMRREYQQVAPTTAVQTDLGRDLREYDALFNLLTLDNVGVNP